MSGLSVVIPSRSAANLKPCLEAVRMHEPAARILVVDDGIDQEDAAFWKQNSFWDGVPAFDLLDGVKPFIFSRNMNIGIEAAARDDVILLNDDALLETPGGFSLMQRAAREHPEYGVISSTTNLAGNPQQQRVRSAGLREVTKIAGHSAPVVAFVCVLIPRSTIDFVGLMDERFGGVTPEGKRIYGFCDNSYCRTVYGAGLKIGVYDGCYVDHGKLKSCFRSEPFDMEAARQIYLEKWGCM